MNTLTAVALFGCLLSIVMLFGTVFAERGYRFDARRRSRKSITGGRRAGDPTRA